MFPVPLEFRFRRRKPPVMLMLFWRGLPEQSHLVFMRQAPGGDPRSTAANVVSLR